MADAAEAKLPHRIFLFYSNRRPEDAPFVDELQALEKQNPRFTLIASMTAMEKSHRRWDGEARKIDREMLTKYLKNAVSPIYSIAGPPEMVVGLQAMLREAGTAEADIVAEEFYGY